MDGSYTAPNGKEYDNAQVIALVSSQSGETPWLALAREAKSNGYITELLLDRAKGRWESVVAYELKGPRLEPSGPDEDVLETLVAEASQTA